MRPIRPTRREVAVGIASLFASPALPAKQMCGSVPDAPVPPQCMAWTVEVISDVAVTSWTVPDGVTAVQIEGWGAGAGGMDISLGDPGTGVWAGGGGAYTVRPFVPVTPGQVIPLQIGQGGSPGQSGTQTVWNGGQMVADCGLANGNGGSSDNCVPSLENVVGGHSYYLAHDGGSGGECLSASVDSAYWNLGDATSNVQAAATSPPYHQVWFTTAASGAVRSTTGHAAGSGKFFWEGGNYLTGGAEDGIGVCTGIADLGVLVTTGAGGVIVRQDGNIYVNGTVAGNIGQALTVVGGFQQFDIALDLVANRIWFKIDGITNWNNSLSADPVAGVGGIDVSGVFTAGTTAFTCVTSNSAYVVANSGPSWFGYWSLTDVSDAIPAGYSAWEVSGPIVHGAGGGAAAGHMRWGGTGDNNGSGDTFAGGGGGANGSGIPLDGAGAMSWSLASGGAVGGGAGSGGSGGGGGPTGGAGGQELTYGVNGTGGGGGGGSSGAGGRGFWGAGGGAGTPGGRGGDGAVAIAYVSPGEECNAVITPGGPYNIVLMDSNAYIYYSTDSGATWTATSVLPASTGFVWFNMVTGVTDRDYGKWAAHAESTRYFPVPGGGGFDFGAVSVAPWPPTNMQTTTPVRFDEMAPGSSPLSQNCAYSPSTHQVFVSNYSSLDSTTGFYYNVDLRYSKDDGLTWQGLPGLQGVPWGNINPRDGQVLNEGWHDICVSQGAQVIYVKEIFSLIHKSSDGGVTWEMLPSGPFFYNTPDSIETRMACSPDGLTVMCTSRFELQFWISHDGGINWISYYLWTWVPEDAGYTYVTDVGMDLTGQIIFIEVYWTPGSGPLDAFYDYFWLSRNGGLTWTQIYPPTAQNTDMSTKLEAAQCKVSPDGSGLIVAYYTSGIDIAHTMIDVSNDGGATWATHVIALTPLGPDDSDFAGQWEDSRIWS